MKNKKAFTLSEVLITLGILGVVASLTMPTLMANYQKQANVTILRKSINDFVDAADMYITEEGKTKLSQTGVMKDNDGIKKFMSSKFKAVESDGFVSNYTSISGKKSNYSCTGVEYILPSSAAVCVRSVQGNGTTKYLHVQIDVNGEKKPNIGGRDMFEFYIDNNANPLPNAVTYELVDGELLPIAKVCGTNAETGKEEGYCHKCLDSPNGEDCYGILKENNWKMTY